ncbi:MAG: DUF2239 family protein [Pseudobdellovibrio sp.]
MTTQEAKSYTAFVNNENLLTGSMIQVALKVKNHLQKHKKDSVLVFDDTTGTVVDLDLRGTSEDIVKRLHSPEMQIEDLNPGPGRPRLGVVSKEITLLPLHWEWLKAQPGGASVTLRKLVDEAKKKNHAKDVIRHAQEITYKFMTAMAGDLIGYEDALRALYANKPAEFKKIISAWPKDIYDYTLKLAKNAF